MITDSKQDVLHGERSWSLSTPQGYIFLTNHFKVHPGQKTIQGYTGITLEKTRCQNNYK